MQLIQWCDGNTSNEIAEPTNWTPVDLHTKRYYDELEAGFNTYTLQCIHRDKRPQEHVTRTWLKEIGRAASLTNKERASLVAAIDVPCDGRNITGCPPPTAVSSAKEVLDNYVHKIVDDSASSSIQTRNIVVAHGRKTLVSSSLLATGMK